MFSRPAMTGSSGRRFFTVTTLDNGFVVATRPVNVPVAKITLAYGAGSRHEKPGALGVSHMLRSMAFQNTQERSAIRISRESELKGTKLSATTSREITGYSASCLADEIPTALSYLADAMRSAKNEAHELNDQRPRLALENASAANNPLSNIFEDLHSISFHRGLGNSVFAPQYRVSSISKSELDDFVADRFLSSARCLVAQGVDHEQAVEFAKNSFGSLVASSPSTESAPKYTGGNSKHTATAGDQTYGVIGFNAVKASDAAAPAVRVLEAIVDGTPSVKYGASLSPVFASADAEGEAFSALYSDAGILGVVVQSEASEFGSTLKAVASQLQSLAGGSLTEEHLKQGKAAAKLQLLQVDESGQAVDEAAEEIIMNNGAPLQTVAERLAAIDAVTLPQLKTVAKQVLGSKRNLVTYGNPTTVPSLADL